MMSGFNNNPEKPVKVAKLIWYIPHYRVPIFRRLSQNPGMDFVVYAGDNNVVWGGQKTASASDVNRTEEINWYKVRSLRVKGPIFHGYEWQPDSVKAIWKEDLDAVICFGNKSLSNWLVRIICKIRSIPLIEWTQGVTKPESGLKWALRKFYMKWAKAHLLYGNFARDFYVAHGFKKEEVFVVYNSLDYDKQVVIRENITDEDIKRTRQEFGITEPEDRLLFHSGRLIKKYELPVLLEGLRKIKQNGRKVKLVLIGEGPEESVLRTEVKQKNIEDLVVFYGACYDEQTIGRIISASDLCVITGWIGLTAMHSLVYGVPILTRENTAWLHRSEIEAVIAGKTGGYFCGDDANDLVAKMEEMLYPQPCKQEMMENCKKIIDKYYNPAYQEKVVIQALNYVLPSDKQIPVPGQ